MASVGAIAQQNPGFELHIKKAKAPVKVDGILDEPDWQEANVASNFFLNYPTDSIAANFQTEARITFDQNFLYLAWVCHDDQKPLVVQSLRRDFEWPLNDNAGIYFDPYNDYTNGFFFGISPFGAQREGTISGGGIDGMNNYNINWDNKWYSEVKRYEDKWVAEIAIPFKSIRFNSEVAWNVNFIRQDLKRNQVSSWIRTPIQNMPSSFPFTGKLVWDDPLPKPGTNVSLIPYVIASSYADPEQGLPKENTANVGFDAKIGLSPSMNLDLTVNPDFSTVDVDRQIVNLTRYEFQYPERRQFFLENSDLFTSSGFTTYTQPFFTRRIGLLNDTTGALRRVPILYGARLSGKIGSDWRIGILNLQTGKTASLGLPAQNYSVAVVQRKVLKMSNLSFVMVNKQNGVDGEYDPDKFYHPSLLKEKIVGGTAQKVLNPFNRIFGTDFMLITPSNRWGGKVYYHRSFDAFKSGSHYSSGAFFNYTRRNARIGFGGVSIQKDFNAEVGFMPGQSLYNGYNGLFIMSDFPFYPKSNSIVTMGPGFDMSYTYRPDGLLVEVQNSLRYSFKFRSTADLTILGTRNYQLLPSDFNPIYPKGDTSLLAGQSYTWNEFNITFNSNSRRLLTARLIASGGQYYNGYRAGFGGTLQYRFQPYGNFSVTWDYNDFRFPSPYGDAKLLLLSPRMDLTLTRKVFITSFLQYNDRFNNVNFNTRFQWRFRPASDFFIVYAENYLPGNFNSKNRSLVLKLTYWFNL
ncbi:MAG: DUF5916 domain-containing protein [Bacteroidota bacterium]